MTDISSTLWLLFGALVAIGFVFRMLLVMRLKKRHRLVWEEVGQPSLFLDTTVREQSQAMRLIWTRRLRTLNDPVIEGLLWTLRSCYALLVIVMLAAPWLIANSG